MFGIGIQELAIIFVVALLIFGPKRLPEFARSLGKGLAEFRRASSDLRQSFSLDVDAPPPPPRSEEDPRTSETEPERPAQTVDAFAKENGKSPAEGDEDETGQAKKPGPHTGA